MTASKLVVWITIIQFACTMIFYWYTFTKITSNEGGTVDKKFIEKTERYTEELEKKYLDKQDAYQKTIDSLNQKIATTELKLSRANHAARRDRTILQEMLAQKWDTLTTEKKLWACDTLRDQVEHYLFTSAQKDTLYKEKIDQLEKVEDNLVKQLVTCDTTMERVATKLDQSLEQNRQMAKEVKKQKRRKTFFKIGTAVLAGVGIFLIVQ